MEFQSFRNAGIAKTPRVSSCAGAAGLGRVDMRAILSMSPGAKKGTFVVFDSHQKFYFGTFLNSPQGLFQV
jgi:hypothetical protein